MFPVRFDGTSGNLILITPDRTKEGNVYIFKAVKPEKYKRATDVVGESTRESVWRSVQGQRVGEIQEERE